MTESFSKNFIDYEEYPQSGKWPPLPRYAPLSNMH